MQLISSGSRESRHNSFICSIALNITCTRTLAQGLIDWCCFEKQWQAVVVCGRLKFGEDSAGSHHKSKITVN